MPSRCTTPKAIASSASITRAASRPPGSRFRQPSDEHDHWHRTGDDPGRPYVFTTADQLLADFFAEVGRVLRERGISDAVVAESGKQRED